MRSLLTDLQKTRKLTPEEEQDNKDVVNNYNQKKSVLTGRGQKMKEEKEELTRDSKSKKKKQTISKTPKVHTVYV